jgi:hypothetical protein
VYLKPKTRTQPATIIPYDTDLGCVISFAKDDGAFYHKHSFYHKDKDSNVFSRQYELLSNVEAACILQDRTFVTIERERSTIFSPGRRLLKEYLPTNPGSHNGHKLFSDLPNNMCKDVKIFRTGKNLAAVICRLDATIEFVRFVPSVRADHESVGKI